MKREALFNLFPEKYKKLIEQEAKYADTKNYIGLTLNVFTISLSVFILVALFLNVSFLIKLTIVVSGIAFAFFLPYIIITLIAEKRKNEIEQILPDALMLMSANIKSGLTVDKAFLLSAREEFGPLAQQIREVAMEIFSGKPINVALEGMKKRTNSEILAEIITLLIDGIKSGGELSKLLESSARDIRKTMLLRKEIAANVRMYILFIIMASLLGSPLLFAISTYLTSTTAQTWGSMNVDFSTVATYGFLSFQKPSFNPHFFKIFSILAIIITNFSAAFIISEIKYGTIKRGFKSAPIYILISLLVFFAVRYIISRALASLI